MPAKVNFDGPNKLIIEIEDPYTPTNNTLDVKDDIYSEWKRWVQIGDNSKYQPAMRNIGGDPISGSVSVGGTFFLINGWKIRPAELDHTLLIDGNLYVEGGGNPFVPTLGTYNVLINTTVSNIINTVNTGGSSEITISPEQIQDIAEAVEIQLDPILTRILGLTHNNFRLFDQEYDVKGNMTFGRIRLYDSATDLNNDVNPIAEYEVQASYDANGKMTEYKSIAL